MSRVSQARNLGKYFLLIDNMLVVLGFFVVFPLISIRFVDQMGWAAVMVGIALGLRQFIQQGLGIFGGAIADRFGAKPMIVTGMLMRAAGFATMGIAHEPWLLWFSCLLSGLGGTLFDPPRSALVYGHTHIKVNEKSAEHDVWVFNPGSVGIPKDGSTSYGVYEDGRFEHRLL